MDFSCRVDSPSRVKTLVVPLSWDFLAICFPNIDLGKRVGSNGLMKTKERPIPPDQRRALRHLAWNGHDGITEGLLGREAIGEMISIEKGGQHNGPRY